MPQNHRIIDYKMVIILKILRRNTRGAFAFIVFEISRNSGFFIETRFGYLRKGHQCVSAYGSGDWHLAQDRALALQL